MATGLEQERVFAAIRLRGEALQTISEWSQEMQIHYHFRKWTSPADFHITLQFFGDVDRKELPQLHEVLQHTAEQTKPFRLEFGAEGYFGIADRPRVWWIAPAGQLEPLYDLQRTVQQHCESLGYLADKRPYHPHITVARKYADERPFTISDSTLIHGASSWLVEEMVLYQTRLGQVPMYDPSIVFSFSGA